MEPPGNIEKQQEEFWKALIKKYEQRNLMLEQQILTLQAQLEQKGIASENAPEESTSHHSICSCTPCLAKKLTAENEDKSLFSLSSTDLQYMLQIKDLIDHQKEMKQKLDFVQQNGPAEGTEKELFKECKCEEAATLNNTLLEENQRLNDELKNVKLEMEQCIEKIKGPITRQIEKEKSKNKFLENQLSKISLNTASIQQALAAETEDLKNQINSMNKELSVICVVNSKLEEQLRLEKCKCKELEATLINQKRQEAEILKQLKTTQEEEQSAPPKSDTCNCPCTRKTAEDKSAVKKRFSLTSEDLKRFPCYQTRKGEKQGSSVQSTGVGKEKKTKSAGSEKTDFKYCKCQTEKTGTESAKVQAEPTLAEAGAEVEAQQAETAIVTEDTAVEAGTATNAAETQEVTAETTKDTAEAVADATPDTEDTGT